MTQDKVTKEMVYMYATLEVAKCIAKAQQHYKRDFPMPTLSFSLSGQCVGVAWTNYKGKGWMIELNKAFFVNNWHDMIEDTIPHEVAHLIADTVFCARCHHDWRWKLVMKEVFNVKAERCHNYCRPTADMKAKVK